MAALTTTTVNTLGGLADLDAAAVAAAGGGDTAPVGDGLFLFVNNAGASPRTVTLATPGTVHGHQVADATLTVAAGKRGLIPLTTIFRGATGRAAITYDAVTSVTVAVIQLGA
ncbi:hypothetical protein [Streptomyces nymphaeiformis]|jgi:hypothetical protein|uniref:Uncharacterized protein n=1 Tax=Streptomyces nymphaeiformis TaxID=2663842 RepID=A0A7W7UC70_9ACTN|nr:hypothetical protein [Streptomyces nymphaeiformis]MBB4987495.1 hypothetical protein [Streptomyces nymphaeiformis]